MIVTSIDTLTSLIGGFTIFAILGNLAHNLGIDNIGEVVKSGTGLAFIRYRYGDHKIMNIIDDLNLSTQLP